MYLQEQVDKMLAEAKRLGALAKRFIYNPELKRLDKQLKETELTIRKNKADCDALSAQVVEECYNNFFGNPDGLTRRLVERYPSLGKADRFPAWRGKMDMEEKQNLVLDFIEAFLLKDLVPFRKRFLRSKREARCADL